MESFDHRDSRRDRRRPQLDEPPKGLKPLALWGEPDALALERRGVVFTVAAFPVFLLCIAVLGSVGFALTFIVEALVAVFFLGPHIPRKAFGPIAACVIAASLFVLVLT